MWLMAFFGLCVLCFVAGLWAVKDCGVRRNALILSAVGFLAGFLVEFWGVSGDRWAYHETDIGMICNIPIEIIIGYGTGMFLMALLIYYLFRYFEENERLTVLKIFPFVGFMMFFMGFLHDDIPIIIGMGFLAIWGLMISSRQSIPLLVGLVTFVSDIVVEGLLSIFTNYYVWHLGIAFSFMLIGIFISGIMTRKKCKGDGDFCFVENY